MTRKISLGGTAKAAASAINKASKVRPPKKGTKVVAKTKAPDAEQKKAPATANLQTAFGIKMAKAFRAAVGKPIAALSASITASTEKVVEGTGISMQALNSMAHRGEGKHWGKQPSLDARALEAGKVQFTAYGVGRYQDCFNATKK